MTLAQFEKLVEQIERRFGGRSAALCRRLFLWLALGMALFLGFFLGSLVLGLAALYGGTVLQGEGAWVLLLCSAVLLMLGVLQFFTLVSVTIDPPEGVRITREQAPALFAALLELQQQLDSPEFHEVLLLPEFNAGVYQVPQWGVFGRSRCYLCLGATLMDACSPDEFRAVLAHEISHFSRKHHRFGNQIYQVRRLWSSLFQKLTANESGDWKTTVRVLAWFMTWYWPRFNAYAFVLCRHYEFEADRLAAEQVGIRAALSALWKIECLSRAQQEDFWPELWRKPAVEISPPDDILIRCREFLTQEPDSDRAQRWMEQTCAQITDLQDTHPCLLERAGALGIPARELMALGFPRPEGPSATEVFLSPSADSLQGDVSRQWQKAAAPAWAVTRSSLLRDIQAAESTANTETTSEEDNVALWDQAVACFHRDGFEAAEPLLQTLSAGSRAHVRAQLFYGRQLLSRGRGEGLLLLNKLMQDDDPQIMPQATQILIEHYLGLGDAAQVSQLRRRLDEFEKEQTEFNRERFHIKPGDQFVPHGLSSAELKVLSARLISESDLTAAWLVRKQLPHFPHRRLFVLCVQTVSASQDAALIAKLTAQVPLPGAVFIVSPKGEFRRLARKVSAFPNAEVFPHAAGM